MRGEARNPKGRAIAVAHAYEIMHGARALRANLLTAGIDRDELQRASEHLRSFDVRSLRTTFATWCSQAGYDSAWIRRWLGDRPVGTAEKDYNKHKVRRFEDALLKPAEPGTIGAFPKLPESLLGFGGVLVREAKMNSKTPSERRFAWVLNLDADLELALPHGYTPRRAVLLAMKPYVAQLASSLFGPDDRLVDEAFAALPASERAAYTGRAFCPTPRAVAALRRAGVTPEPHPEVDVLRRVNARAFAAALGQTLPGAIFVTALDAALAVLATPPPTGNGWRVKRNFGMTGRGQRVLTRAPDDGDRAFLRAGMTEGGVQLEPNLSIDAEYGIHGMLDAGGEHSLGVVVRQRCDARGAWLATEPVSAPTQHDLDVAAAIRAEAERVAGALAKSGYFGPFGVDSYVYRSENGNLDIQLRSEINARYSMGFAIGFAGNERVLRSG